MEQGDTIRVLAYGGEELERRVIDIGEKVVQVCSEEEFRKAKAEERSSDVVGFLLTDIIAARK